MIFSGSPLLTFLRYNIPPLTVPGCSRIFFFAEVIIKRLVVLFSFFSRFISRKPPNAGSLQERTVFDDIAHETKGICFTDFKLYHYERVTTVDVLLFLPHRGLYAGEKISWKHDELKGATLERSLPGGKKKASTRFNAVESAIRQKLEDVLSFDSTPCERFAWMEHLSEEEFDTLDPSFHELLPKTRLIFSGESAASARQKLEKLEPYRDEPYSDLKVIGSLTAHMLLLPTSEAPFGTSLAEEQRRFLDAEFTDTVTTLYGASGSGKSTILLRKAIKYLLENPHGSVLIITPTLLAGELLRNKLISLMEYGAFSIPLSSLSFYTPQLSETLEDMRIFDEASVILCDDAYRLESSLIDKLKERRGKRWLLLCTAVEPDSKENLFVLHNRYRDARHLITLQCTESNLMFTLIMELRKRLADTPKHDIMVVLPEAQMLLRFKRSIDEYFNLDSRILIPGFSLQYQNLDDLILATADYISGLRIPHLLLIVPEETDDYTFELSRASETATIITYQKSDGESDAENTQNQ